MLGFPIKGYLQIMHNYIDLLYPFMTISKPWFWGTPILGNLQWILSIHCKYSPKIGVQTAETVTIGGCGECLAPVAVQNKEHVQLHWAVTNRSMSILVDGTYTNIITKSSWSITMVLINQQWQPNTTGRAAHCREFYTCFFFVLYEPLLTNRHRMAGFWRLHGADQPPGFFWCGQSQVLIYPTAELR